jgi:hypothetical protein
MGNSIAVRVTSINTDQAYEIAIGNEPSSDRPLFEETERKLLDHGSDVPVLENQSFGVPYFPDSDIDPWRGPSRRMRKDIASRTASGVVRNT